MIQKLKEPREVYFENENGKGVFLKIPIYFQKNKISVNYLWLEMEHGALKSSISLRYRGLMFIDYANDLSENDCNDIFGSTTEYISFLYHKGIRTKQNPKAERWILLFNSKSRKK